MSKTSIKTLLKTAGGNTSKARGWACTARSAFWRLKHKYHLDTEPPHPQSGGV